MVDEQRRCRRRHDDSALLRLSASTHHTRQLLVMILLLVLPAHALLFNSAHNHRCPFSSLCSRVGVGVRRRRRASTSTSWPSRLRLDERPLRPLTNTAFSTVNHLRNRLPPSETTLELSVSSTNDDGVNDDSEETSTTRIPQWLRSVGRFLIQSSNPLYQGSVLVALYFFHLTVLCQHQLVFSRQLGPANLLRFGTAIGWDSMVGVAVAAAYAYSYYKSPNDRTDRDSPSSRLPFELPGPSPVQESSSNDNDDDKLTDQRTNDNKKSRFQISPRLRWKTTVVMTTALLLLAYIGSGRCSLFWENILYETSYHGWVMTIPMFRSVTVLLGHLSWVAMGCALLQYGPRPPAFFTSSQQASPGKVKDPRPYRWFTWKHVLRSQWLWWTLGGYCVSSWLFAVADSLNQVLLPETVLLQAQPSLVSELVQPEHNDFAASFVGALAPCLTAPVWEEVLYRGFCLPSLVNWSGLPCFNSGSNNDDDGGAVLRNTRRRPFFACSMACMIQAIVFSAHHQSVTAALPLFVLGWLWSVIYLHSGNLWNVIAIHALWNSRVFLSSWLGL